MANYPLYEWRCHRCWNLGGTASIKVKSTWHLHFFGMLAYFATQPPPPTPPPQKKKKREKKKKGLSFLSL